MLVNSEHSIVELDTTNGSGILSVIPKAIGPRLETSLGGVVNISRPPGSMAFRSNAEFATVLLSPSPNMEAAFASDRLQTFHAPVGMLVVNPSNVDRLLRWTSTKQNAAIAFSAAAYAELAACELEGGEWELQPPKFGHVDLPALRLAKVMAEETSRPSANLLYLDSLLTIFGIHLIRTYSNAKIRPGSVTSRRLAGHTSRRVLEYMNEKMSQSVMIGELAKVARMSPSHFIRAFTVTFGMPPHQYLMNIRIREAERLLIETKLPISDIAFHTGFSSQSHLTNSMKRMKQVTPGQIRSDQPAQETMKYPQSAHANSLRVYQMNESPFIERAE